MKTKILIIVTSAAFIGPKKRPTGSLLTELAHPYIAFEKQGYDIDIYSIGGGEAPIEMNDVNDPVNAEFLKSDGPEKMKCSKRVAEIGSLESYDAIFIPGGLGPVVDMADYPPLQNLIANCYESGKIISAVCHGPVALANVKLSDGSNLVYNKHLTAFSSLEESGYAKDDVPFELESFLKEHGAKYSAKEPWMAYTVTDGKLVTGQNPASAQGVAEEVIKLLEQQIAG